MKNRRGISGFTMAEMLIVVAIIAVLGGVGFVAVQNYQRSMAQLECDAIAKEIFVAAQNHLTMADSQGYLGIASYGTPETIDEDTDIFGRKQVYYYTVNGNIPDRTLLSLMLPFGSIDETVRLGGSYIIRYQPNSARVLDVFYCSTTDPRFKHRLTESDYNLLLNIVYDENGDIKENNKDGRKEYGNSKAVVGWFGGISTVSTGVYTLEAPTIRVFNEETLSVEITDPNLYRAPELMPNLKLIVSGKEAEVSFLLTHFDSINNPIKPSSTSMKRLQKTEDDPSSKKIIKYTILLDDITQEEMHFADLNKSSSETGVNTNGKAFIPGEDITIQAVSYSNSELTNIAYSPSWTTNSLFGYVETVVDEETTMNVAMIGNFRHLENLDDHISGLGSTLKITHAKQIADLSAPPEDDSIPEPSAEPDPELEAIEPSIEGKKDLSWAGFKKAVGSPDTITIYGSGDTTGTVDFRPISPSYALDYDGQGHEISGIVANYSENAGLFGSLIADSHVKNLKLIDFEIKSNTGNAGALAGTLNNTKVSNVLAYHNNGSEQTTITATNGDAGGLVGTMTGGQIKQCAAALYVQAGTNAGGLVGSVKTTEDATSQAAIIASYSGGHTEGGYYSKNTNPAEAKKKVTDSEILTGLVNVIGGTNAGGLVGYASNTKINSCYSTCSASGTTAAGGLIGSVDNATGKTVTVNYCYAAGLVKSDAHAGTFLGQPDPEYPKELATGSANNHYVSGINGTLGSGAGESVVKVFEMSKVTDKATTSPYDATLTDKRYSYLTVAQLSGNATDESHLKIHYGDWQEPVDLDAGLEIINAERLTARLSFNKDNLGDSQLLTMLIKGETSGQTAYLLFEAKEGAEKPTLSLLSKIPKPVAGATVAYYGNEEIGNWLNNVRSTLNTANGFISIDLDDITSKTGHFAQLFPTFIPGEDIIVAIRGNEVSTFEMQVVIAATVADPLKKETNSLFASVNSEKNASISNFRHLENLDRSVSNVAVDTLSLQNAIQTEDLVWENFCKTINAVTPSNVKVYYAEEATDAEGNITTTIQSTVGGCFKPVAVSYALNYNGQSTNANETTTIHSITGVKVDCTGDAGLFGSMVDGSSVSNLELIDFSVTGTGDAGALAGTLTNTTVSNVLAHHTPDSDKTTITATGNAGGLIGSMTGGKVEKCAAAVIVSAGDDTHVGNAGGLIGTISGEASVSASYSGGHTSNAAYSLTNYNVTATGTAGGLIGIAGGATISNCYSTCSAKGETVGGFVGTSSGNITNCYATGLVSGMTKGAFAGKYSTGTAKDCLYYEIINVDLLALADAAKEGISALDATVDTYNTFVGSPTDWQRASAYDKPALDRLFGENNYSLKTVAQLLGITTINNNFVATHYGDWPAPEMLVVNTSED